MPGSTPVLHLPYPTETDPITVADFAALANAIDLAQAATAASATALLTRPLARVQAVAGQTSAAGATISLNMDTTASRVTDNTGMFNPGTPDRLTCTVRGVYLISWHDVFLISGFTTVTVLEAVIYVNGVEVFGERQPGSVTSAGPLEVGVHLIWPLNVGDFIQGRVAWNGTGGPATWQFGAGLEASYVCPIT
jgi:hypothetical protein